MHQAEVYVVRVYRREAGGATGVVEDVQRGTSHTFRSVSELTVLIVSKPSEEKHHHGPDADPS